MLFVSISSYFHPIISFSSGNPDILILHMASEKNGIKHQIGKEKSERNHASFVQVMGIIGNIASR
jgi:hypothetical protein